MGNLDLFYNHPSVDQNTTFLYDCALTTPLNRELSKLFGSIPYHDKNIIFLYVNALTTQNKKKKKRNHIFMCRYIPVMKQNFMKQKKNIT